MTRERLLRAGARVAARSGLRGASVQAVAEEAGYSFGAVYSNFANRDELLLAIFEDSFERQAAEYASAFAQGVTDGERADFGAQRWMGLLRDMPAYFPLFIEFWSEAVRNPAARERFLRRYAGLRQSISLLLAEAASQRGHDLDTTAADRLSTVVLALGNGMALEKLARGDEIPDELFGWALGTFFGGLSAQR